MKFEKYLKKITEDLDEITNSVDTSEGNNMDLPEVIDVTNGSTEDVVIDKAQVMDEIHELLEKLSLDPETVIELSKQIADKAGVGWTEEEEEEREELSDVEGSEDESNEYDEEELEAEEEEVKGNE